MEKKKNNFENEFAGFLSDYVFNYNLSFKEIDTIFEKAKLKIKKDIKKLSEQVENVNT